MTTTLSPEFKDRLRKLLHWRNPFSIAAAVLFLAVAGTGIFFLARGGDGGRTYDYIEVVRAPMRVTLREGALIAPEHRLNVTPPIAGRIDSVTVLNGDLVKQGQILGWISSTNRAALMDAARAAGGKEIDFWNDVFKPAPLVAPLDGRIISTAVVPGQVVVAAQAVFTMSDHLIVQSNVDETDLKSVRVGQDVEVTFDSFPELLLKGTVHDIAYDATIVNNVTTYLVNIFLKETPPVIRSGVSANVFLIVSNRQDVLQIPTDALSPDNEVLFVPGEGETPVPRKIEIGESSGEFTEVLSGLDEHDWIARRTFVVQKFHGNGFSLFSSGDKGKDKEKDKAKKKKP
jgi:macrolide-specific efflux system membrane fusion protein